MNFTCAQIGALNGRVVLEHCRATGSDNAPRLDEVAAIGDLEAQPGILLDQQDADSG